MEPFQGELMTCVICGKEQQSDPAQPSGWRCVVTSDGHRFYACPDEFPPDPASVQAFGLAYARVLTEISRRQ